MAAQLEDPSSLDIHEEGKYLMLAVQELVSGDLCEGRFVFGREVRRATRAAAAAGGGDGGAASDRVNPKCVLQTLLMRAGHGPPRYKTKHLKTNEFRALVELKGMQFVGKAKKSKQMAERDAAIEALAWLTQTTARQGGGGGGSDEDSPPDVTENMLKLLGKPRRRRAGRRQG